MYLYWNNKDFLTVLKLAAASFYISIKLACLHAKSLHVQNSWLQRGGGSIC